LRPFIREFRGSFDRKGFIHQTTRVRHFPAIQRETRRRSQSVKPSAVRSPISGLVRGVQCQAKRFAKMRGRRDFFTLLARRRAQRPKAGRSAQQTFVFSLHDDLLLEQSRAEPSNDWKNAKVISRCTVHWQVANSAPCRSLAEPIADWSPNFTRENRTAPGNTWFLGHLFDPITHAYDRSSLSLLRHSAES